MLTVKLSRLDPFGSIPKSGNLIALAARVRAAELVDMRRTVAIDNDDTDAEEDDDGSLDDDDM